MAMLGHVAALGERVEVAGFDLEVIELDGRRIARVRVKRRPAVESPPDQDS
jgi:putative hemolysin